MQCVLQVIMPICMCYLYCMYFVGYLLSVESAKFDMDIDLNAVTEEQVVVEQTDDSCGVDSIELVPPARHTDGSCTTESVSEFKLEDLADLKQEPDDVCCVLYPIFSFSQYRVCTHPW